jgi:hypothetical protein
MDRRTDGLTDGRPGGWADGTDEQDRRTDGRPGGRVDRTDERPDGLTDRQEGGRTDAGRPDERTGRTSGQMD